MTDLEELIEALQNLTVATHIYTTLRNESPEDAVNIRKAEKYLKEKECEANVVLKKHMKKNKVLYYGGTDDSGD